MRRAAPFVVMLALGLAGGCFEPPVIEVLLFHFREEGTASASLEVHLAAPDDLEGVGVKRRVKERERALLDGSDAWLARFAAVESDSDALSWDRTKGELRTFRRSVEVADPQALAPLFEADGALWSYSRDGVRAALELDPARGGRAARGERDRVLREIRGWSASYADYVAATRALDAAAVAAPAIAEPLWRAALGHDEEASPELSDDEIALAKRFADALGKLLESFAPDLRDGVSLAERVRDVFHPFAAQVGIDLPCEADEVEGFVEADPGDYVVNDLSLATAAQALEGKWLLEDPFAGFVQRLSLDDPRPRALEFAARSIATERDAPGADEVTRAIVEALRGPERYRLAWSCLMPEAAE